MAQRDLLVRIIGDDRSLLRAFTRSSKGARQFDRDMGRVSRGALAGSGALGGLGRSLAFASGGFLSGAAAIGAVAGAFKELAESRRVTAQTNAVLRSTGRIAGVTAEHVDALGQALLRKTGIDDEAIRSAENLLLTFTNVRNVIGDGNNVFDQATTAILDMSVAMGEDLDSATVRVGKALQDPVRGLTALRRVGVAFTESQQRQITALVRTGRVMEAQKIILRELGTEFGGSAAAAGNVQPWNLLRETILNLSAVLAEKFLPKIQEVTARLQTWLDNPENTKKIEDEVTGAASAVGSFVDALNDANNKGNRAMEGLRRGVTEAALRTRLGVLDAAAKLPSVFGNWAEDERKRVLAELEALRNGATSIALATAADIAKALTIHDRPSLTARAQGAEPPTGGAGARTAGRLTAAQRNTFFDNDIARALRRVQDSDLRGQLAKLAKIAALIKARMRITEDVTRDLNLEDQLLDIRRQRKSVLEQIADNLRASAEDAKAAAEEALEASREAQRKLAEARDRRQFFALGLSPTGGERTPGLKGLRRQLGNFEDAVKGTFLDTKKTESVLTRIRKVLAGGLGKVSEDVRSTIRDMLRDLNQQLKDQRGTLTKGSGLNVDRFLNSLGIPLPRDLEKALRAGLSNVSSSGKVLGGEPAPLALSAVSGRQGLDVHTTLVLDGAVIGRSVTRNAQTSARRIGTQTTGPHAGNASGTNR